MYGCSLQLTQLGMNFLTSPEKTADAKRPFLGLFVLT